MTNDCFTIQKGDCTMKNRAFTMKHAAFAINNGALLTVNGDSTMKHGKSNLKDVDLTSMNQDFTTNHGYVIINMGGFKHQSVFATETKNGGFFIN